jgi:hypothetical protein
LKSNLEHYRSAFRTKPQLAAELIDAVRHDWPFRAVIADCLYGRNEFFVTFLLRASVPFVLALPRSYAWWHEQGQPGGVEEMALQAAPSDWHPLVRTFANGDERLFWCAELWSWAPVAPGGRDTGSGVTSGRHHPIPDHQSA